MTWFPVPSLKHRVKWIIEFNLSETSRTSPQTGHRFIMGSLRLTEGQITSPKPKTNWRQRPVGTLAPGPSFFIKLGHYENILLSKRSFDSHDTSTVGGRIKYASTPRRIPHWKNIKGKSGEYKGVVYHCPSAGLDMTKPHISPGNNSTISYNFLMTLYIKLFFHSLISMK